MKPSARPFLEPQSMVYQLRIISVYHVVVIVVVVAVFSESDGWWLQEETRDEYQGHEEPRPRSERYQEGTRGGHGTIWHAEVGLERSELLLRSAHKGRLRLNWVSALGGSPPLAELVLVRFVFCSVAVKGVRCAGGRSEFVNSAGNYFNLADYNLIKLTISFVCLCVVLSA